MYRNHLIIIIVTWLTSFFLSYAFDLSYSTDISGQIITVIAIFFGFYVTSASLILAGDAIIVMHDTVDYRGDRRLTHTLRDYYSFGLTALLLSLMCFLVISFSFSFDKPSISNFDLSFSLKKAISGLATSLLSVNLIFAFVQTRLFLVLFINEPYAKTKKKTGA